MNTIEFNKNYTKLPAEIKTARLVACEAVRGWEQTEAFIKYDTEYMETETSGGFIKSLDVRPYLCLVLKSDSGAIFTTLRKDNTENREKYMCKLGASTFGKNDWVSRYNEEFQIIIKEG